MSQIEDCIDHLEGKKIFSLLDLKSGFHQVKMTESSVKYTAFITAEGQYEYTVMPFGLKNAPAEVQKYINTIFRDLLDKQLITVYMDDIKNQFDPVIWTPGKFPNIVGCNQC